MSGDFIGFEDGCAVDTCCELVGGGVVVGGGGCGSGVHCVARCWDGGG